MSKRNNLHSFTLWPAASNHVHNTKRGKKSQMVSKAIEWYNKPREFIVKEYEYETTMQPYDSVDGGHVEVEPGIKTYQQKIRLLDLSDLLEGNEQLQIRYSKCQIENLKLRKKKKKNESFISRMLKVFGK